MRLRNTERHQSSETLFRGLIPGGSPSLWIANRPYGEKDSSWVESLEAGLRA